MKFKVGDIVVIVNLDRYTYSTNLSIGDEGEIVEVGSAGVLWVKVGISEVWFHPYRVVPSDLYNTPLFKALR